MNSPRTTNTDRSDEGKPLAIVLVASESISPTDNGESFIASELVLEAEMSRRAAVITEVLARIIDHPAPPRHWGLNE